MTASNQNGLDRNDAVSMSLFTGASVVTAALYSRLPARVPVHFDLPGQVDGWMSRPFGAWILLGGTLVTWILVRFGSYVLPREWRARLESSPTSVLGMLLVALFAALQLVILYAALRPGHSMGVPLALALSAFWIVLGQILPRVRRNPFVGVRTTWTLTSDENWLRTHRLAGFTFTVGGLIGALAALIGLPAVAIVAILVSGLSPAVYSYFLARRLAQ
jgi:uncharacterized membrane protein